MPALRDQAICIRHWDFSETSQTVSLFTREHGMLRGLAKGAKRPRGEFSGGLELLTRGEVLFIAKPGRELALLTAWDLQETFAGLRRDLDRLNAGLYVAELVQHVVRDLDPHPGLFDAMVIALRALAEGAAGPATAAVLLRFQWVLLLEAGYQPRLRALADGSRLPSTGAVQFDPNRGELVGVVGVVGARRPGAGQTAPSAVSARTHANTNGAGGRGPGGGIDWRLRASTARLLASLDHACDADDALGSAGAGADAVLAAPVDAVERASRFLAAYIRHVIGESPRTLPLVFSDL